MQNNITYFGIDVSKKELEIHTYEKSLQLPSALPNTKTGIKKIIAKAKKVDQVHFVFEASGGYEQSLLKMLQDQNLKASRITPSCARHFAKAQGIMSKTDAIDANILTDFGIKMQPRETLPVDPIIEEIRAFMKYRGQLKDELHRQKMQLEHTLPKKLETIIKSRIKQLEKQIEKITQMAMELKSKSPELEEQVKLLTETKGMGELSALMLLAEMPELGTLSNNQAASLAGLAPFNHDSGNMKGKRSIYGGRRQVRSALYMSALVASRHNEILKEFYKKLVNKGKAPKVALTAVMRKLLCHLNSLMRRHLNSKEETQQQTPNLAN